MALLLLDLGTVRQEGPEVTGLLLPLSLRWRRADVMTLKHHESQSQGLCSKSVCVGLYYKAYGYFRLIRYFLGNTQLIHSVNIEIIPSHNSAYETDLMY